MQHQSIVRRLIVEQPSYDLSFDLVQENKDAERRFYISGQYAMIDRKNKNNRKYLGEDFVPAADAFIKDFVKENRAIGELNHSEKADMDLERLAHKIVDFHRESDDSKYFIGKSKVLSSPCGKILETLIRDDVRFGMSTKCLGQICESSDGNVVKSPIILGVDAVYDPSVATAFVNGILENKEYIISDKGEVSEAYKVLEKRMAKYPGKHSAAIKEHVYQSLTKFIDALASA